MRQRLKRWWGFFMCLVIICEWLPMEALAAPAWPAGGVSIEADGGIVMDAETGAVLYGKNQNQTYFPASITKLLTAQVVLDHCQLDETVTFSQNAVYNVESGSKSLGMDTGDQLSVKDCLYGMLLHSANEVANALAEHTAGSIEEFAVMMNEKAKELGCVNFNFVLPSGLNDPNHYTTPYDMALISKAALTYPEIVEVLTTRIYKIPPFKAYPEGRNISPGHKMLKELESVYDPDVFGGKTGYTSLAGNTLVTYARKDGMTLAAVILNGHQTHYTDTRALLDFGFDNFKSLKITDYDAVYESIKDNLTIDGAKEDKSLLLLDEASTITLPKDAELSDAQTSLSYEIPASAPEGTVALVQYTYEGEMVGTAYLKKNPAVQSTVSQTSPSVEEENPSNPSGKKEKTDSGFPTVPLIILAVLLLCGGGCAVLLYRRRKEEAKRLARRKQRREQWRRESGYSAEEFNSLLEQRRKSSGKKQNKRRK